MKHIILLISIIILSSSKAIAQDKNTKKADKQFAKFEFIDAAESYYKLVESDKATTYVYERLADCYYNIYKTTEAEMWYAKALANSDNPETMYKYSQMLKANGKFEASNAWMSKFAERRPSDKRALAFKANPDYLPKILEKGKRFVLSNLDFNSEFSDFGSTIQDGKLYIVSARNSARKTYGWNEQPFLDIMEVDIRSDNTYGNAYLLDNKINTKYHEGTVSFSPDGNTMYFSRESFFEKLYEKDSISNNKFSVLNIYKATKTKYGWDNIEALPFNSNNFNVDHPSLSRDGKTLYFTSDMPGGFGSSDIYKIAINDNGGYGQPINLGQKVNTEGREMFPFIDDDETIYFSSDGHMGLGGLDVFFTKEIDGKMASVRNIGIPVNSSADDFAFVMSTPEEGFVSSNRFGGKGSDDIYALKKLQPICDVLVSANIIDAKTKAIIEGASVTLYDSQENKLGTKTTDSSGNVEFMIECDSPIKLEVTNDDYDGNSLSIYGTRDEEVSTKIALNPIEKLIVEDRILLNPIYFDFDKSNITAQAAFELDKLVQIMTKYPDLVINASSHTDSRGNDYYNERLSDRRAKTTVQYVISKGVDATRISGQGKGEKEPIFNCGSKCNEEEHQQNRRSEFVILSGGPTSQ